MHQKTQNQKPLTKKLIGDIELSQEVQMLRTVVRANRTTTESAQFNCMYEMIFSKDVSEMDQFNSNLQIGSNQVNCFGLHFYGSLN